MALNIRLPPPCDCLPIVVPVVLPSGVRVPEAIFVSGGRRHPVPQRLPTEAIHEGQGLAGQGEMDGMWGWLVSNSMVKTSNGDWLVRVKDGGYWGFAGY